MSNNSVVSELNGLIITLRDLNLLYRQSAKEANDTALRTELYKSAQRCASIRAQIEAEIRTLGGQPCDSPSMAGKLREIWIEIKAVFTDDDEQAVLKTCDSQQSNVADRFCRVMDDEQLPRNIREVLRPQLAKIRSIGVTIDEYAARYATS